MIDYTTLANVKGYGDFQTNVADATIGGFITAVSRLIDTYCNQTFGTHTATYSQRGRVDSAGVLWLHPPTPVVATLDSLSYRVNGVAQTISTSNIEIEESKCGAVVRVYGASIASRAPIVQCAYTGGWAYNDIPSDFELKVRRAVYFEIKLRSAPLEKTITPDFGQMTIPGSWPVDLAQAFEPYKRFTI